MKMLPFLLLAGCDLKGDTGTEDSGTPSTPYTTEHGDCTAPSGEAQTWAELSGMGYVETWSTETFVIDNDKDWASWFPKSPPQDVGLDLTTHVAAGVSWSTGGCDWPDEEVTAMIASDTQAHLEVTFDHTGENNCDMGILAQKVFAVPRHDTVTVCMKTIED